MALATGVALGAFGATASVAEAATAHAWSAKCGTSAVSAWGTYTRTSSKVVVSGFLRDNSTHHYAACVRFKFTKGAHVSYSGHAIQYTNRALADGHFTIQLNPLASANTAHAYVQKCQINVSTHKISLYSWSKIFLTSVRLPLIFQHA
jgi:hypothetical protein